MQGAMLFLLDDSGLSFGNFQASGPVTHLSHSSAQNSNQSLPD
jgi:hypothetical protein